MSQHSATAKLYLGYANTLMEYASRTGSPYIDSLADTVQQLSYIANLSSPDSKVLRQNYLSSSVIDSKDLSSKLVQVVTDLSAKSVKNYDERDKKLLSLLQDMFRNKRATAEQLAPTVIAWAERNIAAEDRSLDHINNDLVNISNNIVIQINNQTNCSIFFHQDTTINIIERY
jgi:hypothetical protein